MSTDAKRRGNARYLATKKTVTIRMQPEAHTEMQGAAVAAGQILQGYILQAVRERMEREQDANLERDGKAE